MQKFISLTQGKSSRVIVNPTQIRVMHPANEGTALYFGLSDQYEFWIVNESMEEIMELING